MNADRIEEFAALHAAGALEGVELAQLEQLLSASDPVAVRESARFQDVAALAAVCLSAPFNPPADLKNKIMGRISNAQSNDTAMKPPLANIFEMPGFKYIFSDDKGDWIPLKVPGASVKLLSLDAANGYAVVLGKLEAGASYPPHTHINTEQVFMLSGDLHIGAQRLGPGDFHQADGGTRHEVNYSETGCTILAIISKADLEAQMA
ncbi:MAG: cupin domain-containing protein [Verrucomicrobiota bacterium]